MAIQSLSKSSIELWINFEDLLIFYASGLVFGGNFLIKKPMKKSNLWQIT
jgi:hypothetical protein